MIHIHHTYKTSFQWLPLHNGPLQKLYINLFYMFKIQVYVHYSGDFINKNSKQSNHPYWLYLQDFFAAITLTKSTTAKAYIIPCHLTTEWLWKLKCLLTLGPWMNVKAIQTGIKL